MKLAPMLPIHDRAIAAGADQTSDAGTIKTGPGSRRGCRIHIVTTKTQRAQPASVDEEGSDIARRDHMRIEHHDQSHNRDHDHKSDTRRTSAKYADGRPPQAVWSWWHPARKTGASIVDVWMIDDAEMVSCVHNDAFSAKGEEIFTRGETDENALGTGHIVVGLLLLPGWLIVDLDDSWSLVPDQVPDALLLAGIGQGGGIGNCRAWVLC